MASSTFLRRISSSQILRSRMISTATSGSVASPWLMLSRMSDEENDAIFRFQCCVNSQIYSFFNNGTKPRIDFAPRYVGSSHGWLAFHKSNKNSKEKRDLFLSDPTTQRLVKLPPVDTMGELHRLILSERQGKAFMIHGEAYRLAFCSPQQSNEWTPFGHDEDNKYESIVYSSSHRRLLCLTSTFKLEAWDVARELPSLDWVTQFDIPGHLYKQQPGLITMIYLACWEESGELFAVVRRVDPSRGYYFGTGAVSEFAHPTVDFEAYKIDRAEGVVVKMEESLEGLTMFVGMNHPMAIKDVVGVKPNAIYFGYDKRAGPIDHNRLLHRDYGVFDYQKRCVVRHDILAAKDFVSEPIWFIPHRHHTI